MTVNVTKDIVYQSDLDLKLDVYENSEGSRAAILDIHGGGWVQGDKAKEAGIATKFAEQGFLVVVPNYRLAPAAFYPAARDDVWEAYQWLKSSPFNFDHSKIGVFGGSAGGSLSVDVGLKDGIPAVSWSGIFDIIDWFSKHKDVVPVRNTELDTVSKSNEIDQGGKNDPYYKWFILNYVNQDESKFPGLEPFDRVTAKAGPIYLANSLEEIVPTTGVTMLEEALAKVDVPVVTQLVSGGRHAEGYEDVAWQPTLDFFNQYLA